MENLVEDMIKSSFDTLDDPNDKEAAFAKQRNLIVDDFGAKRAQLRTQLFRDLANECYNICVEKGRKKDAMLKDIQELNNDKAPVDLEFSSKEELCVQKCSVRVRHLYKVIDRHVDE